jgi:hypothetical protein
VEPGGTRTAPDRIELDVRARRRFETAAMTDAIPEPVFPEEDPYPAYRTPAPIARDKGKRSPIDEYVLAAVIATGTVLVESKMSRRITEI